MTDRLPIRALDPGPAIDGQVATYDAATGRMVWADASTSGPSALDNLTDVDTTTTAPADGDALVYHAASGMWLPGAISGAGGGGGGVVLLEHGASVPSGTATGTVVFEKGLTATTWDFRGLSALPAGWSRRGVASETFDAAGMSATYAAGQGHEIATPGGAANDMTLEAKFVTGGTSEMVGPIIADASGLGASSFWYTGPVGCLVGKSTAWQYGSDFSNAGGTPTYPAWFRIRRASTLWSASYSLDGTTWSAEATITVSGGGGAKLSVGSLLSSVAVKIEYVKYYPGAGSGGLRGWWNGSAIVPF